LSWGARAAPRIARAWECFAEAFKLYPCVNEVLYFSPITRSPAYHLDLRHEPQPASTYNWGIDHQRLPQPFEDRVSRWLGPFTATELIRQFRAMARQWSAGLNTMRDCLATNPGSADLRRQYAVAAATRLQFLSAANAIEFYALRDAPSPATLRHLRAIVIDDIALAREMQRQLRVEPFIGFHTEMLAYSYSGPLLDAKRRQSRRTLKLLDQWLRTGRRPRSLKDDIQPPIAPTRKGTSYDKWVRYLLNQATWQGPIPKKPSHRDWLQHGD